MLRFLLAKRARLALFVIVCAGYFYGLGYAPLLGSDEPRYAQVAREMFARRDVVTPTLAGHTWFEKPALLYWLMMAGYGIFGMTEFAARLGSALAGVLTVLLVGWLGARIAKASGEERHGFSLLCAAVMASSAGLVVFSRAASFDIILTLTLTLTLACLLVSEL
ncbi:MAG: phospholipid carrier-dependent glycosyltransferase, partial [Pyrinomonadaceae bacterium]